MPVRYCTYEEIDKKKWDECIANAPNGLIYGYSYYLDAMARHWAGLVYDDYQAVMPLTWNRKYGISYLYQPPFTACLGVFGKEINTKRVQEFLNAVPKKFRYWDIYFNPGNHFTITGFELYERMNYVLPLNETYEYLYGHYKENIRRNIKKGDQFQLLINKNIPISEVIELAKTQAHGFAALPEEIFRNFEVLYQLLYQQEKATAYGVYANDGKLVASAVFFFSHNRAYYIMVGNHPDGKTLGASHSLINAFIKDHAGQNLLLDFEGSDIPSLAFFYSSFGAREEKYSAIKQNRLPWWGRWLKK